VTGLRESRNCFDWRFTPGNTFRVILQRLEAYVACTPSMDITVHVGSGLAHLVTD
jgi:hypothetical protein